MKLNDKKQFYKKLRKNACGEPRSSAKQEVCSAIESV